MQLRTVHQLAPVAGMAPPPAGRATGALLLLGVSTLGLGLAGLLLGGERWPCAALGLSLAPWALLACDRTRQGVMALTYLGVAASVGTTLMLLGMAGSR